jgi:hypothetical protein
MEFLISIAPTLENKDNCQVGIFLAYFKKKKRMLIDPTFRSKISFVTIFDAIDFQFNINLLDICAGIKGGYMCI